MDGLGLIVIIIVLIVSVFIIRLFGAWMLRIDEVIELLRAILKELRSSAGSIESKAKAYDAMEEAKRKIHREI